MVILMTALAFGGLHAIGNSLTNNALPHYLPDGQRSIYSGKPIWYIADNPGEVDNGIAWTSITNDTISVQPHWSSDLSRDSRGVFAGYGDMPRRLHPHPRQ